MDRAFSILRGLTEFFPDLTGDEARQIAATLEQWADYDDRQRQQADNEAEARSRNPWLSGRPH